MKKMLFTLALCILAGAGLSAQPPGGGQGGQRGRMGVNLDEIPNITAEQKTKVEAQMTKMREQMETFRNSGNTDRDQMMQKMQELQDSTNAEVEKILNEEQYKVYIQKQEEMRQRGPQGGPGGGQGGRPQSNLERGRDFGQPFAGRFEQPRRPREMASAHVDRRSDRQVAPRMEARRSARPEFAPREGRSEMAPRQGVESRRPERNDRPARPERPVMPQAPADPA